MGEEDRPTARGRLTSDWWPAVLWAVVAAVAAALLAELLILGAYALSDSPLAVRDVARLGGVVFYWFHHVGMVFEASGVALPGVPSTAGAFSFTATVSLALMLGTFLVMSLLARGGRAVAVVAGGPGWVRGIRGMKVALPYAVICLGVAWLVELEVAIPGTSFRGALLSIRPSYVAAGAWPLALGLVAGFFGGWRSAPRERRPSEGWDRRLRAAGAGAATMLALGLGLSLLGLALVVAIRPGSAGRYVEELLAGGGVRSFALIALHVLALPNIAVSVLFPAMGSCMSVVGREGSACLMSYASFPRATGGELLQAVVGGASRAELGPAPPGYLAFLLVPLVAVVAGGMVAATRAGPGSRAGGAGVGALAGSVFAVLAVGAALLAGVSVEAATEGAGRSSSTLLRLGPDPWTGAAFAATWGVVGGALGGLARSKTRSGRRAAALVPSQRRTGDDEGFHEAGDEEPD